MIRGDCRKILAEPSQRRGHKSKKSKSESQRFSFALVQSRTCWACATGVISSHG